VILHATEVVNEGVSLTLKVLARAIKIIKMIIIKAASLIKDKIKNNLEAKVISRMTTEAEFR